MWLWRLLKKREIRAMMVADGQTAPEGADPRLVRRYKALSALVSQAKEEFTPPPFEQMYQGVVRKERELRQAEVRQGIWGKVKALIERKPLWVLAPTGAVLAAVVLTWMLHFGRHVNDNRCVVESYTVKSGVVLIEQDPSDPETPTVIWHIPGG